MRRVFLFVLIAGAALARAPRHSNDVRVSGLHVLTQFQTNMTVFSGINGQTASNTVNVWAGTQSNRISVNSAADVIFQTTISPAANVCADSFVRVQYYQNSQANKLFMGKFKLYLATNTSNYISYDFGFAAKDTTKDRFGYWNQYNIPKRKFTATGTYDCTAINTVLVEILGTGGADTVTLGEVSTFGPPIPKAVLIFTVDDQWSSFQTEGGGAYLSANGMRYTNFINPGLIGAANKLSESFLDSLYKNHLADMSPHLWLHDTVAALSADSFRADYRRSYDYIRGHAWYGAEGLFALPFGTINRSQDSVMRAIPTVDACRIVAGNAEGEVPGYFNPYAVRTVAALATGTTLAAVKTGITDVARNKTVGIFLVHKLCAACVLDANTWLTADFDSLVVFTKREVDSGNVVVQSWGDYMRQTGGGYGSARRVGIGH